MAKTLEYPVIWLQGATCTGCPVSVLNSVSPTIKNLLIDEILPGKHVSLRYQATVMAGCGEQIITAMENTWKQHKGGYILVMEGAIPTGIAALARGTAIRSQLATERRSSVPTLLR